MVLLYTDALTEALAHDGRQLGVEGLARTLGELDASAPEMFIPALLGRLAGEGGFGDDVSVMLVRRNARKPRPSLPLAMLAGARIARDTLTSPFRGALPAWPELSVRALGGAFFSGLNRSSD